MFLWDEKRIINTASVQRFGFVDDNDVTSSALNTSYRMSEPTFANGSVIAEFEKDDQVYEVLYQGSGEACFKFYLNLLQALYEVVEWWSLKTYIRKHPIEGFSTGFY